MNNDIQKWKDWLEKWNISYKDYSGEYIPFLRVVASERTFNIKGYTGSSLEITFNNDGVFESIGMWEG